MHCNLFEHIFLQAKTHKTKVKQAAMSLFKHAKAANGSLNEVVASGRRPFMIERYTAQYTVPYRTERMSKFSMV